MPSINNLAWKYWALARNASSARRSTTSYTQLTCCVLWQQPRNCLWKRAVRRHIIDWLDVKTQFVFIIIIRNWPFAIHLTCLRLFGCKPRRLLWIWHQKAARAHTSCVSIQFLAYRVSSNLQQSQRHQMRCRQVHNLAAIRSNSKMNGLWMWRRSRWTNKNLTRFLFF